MSEAISFGCTYYGTYKNNLWNYTIEINEELNNSYMDDTSKCIMSGEKNGINEYTKKIINDYDEDKEKGVITYNIEKNMYIIYI